MYTHEDWRNRSEVPRDPTQFAFGLPVTWEGFMDIFDNIWAREIP